MKKGLQDYRVETLSEKEMVDTNGGNLVFALGVGYIVVGALGLGYIAVKATVAFVNYVKERLEYGRQLMLQNRPY